MSLRPEGQEPGHARPEIGADFCHDPDAALGSSRSKSHIQILRDSVNNRVLTRTFQGKYRSPWKLFSAPLKYED